MALICFMTFLMTTLCNLPAVNPFGLCREVDTYFIYYAAIILEWLGILLVLNLLQGFVGTLIELEFHNIDVVSCLD